MNTNRRTINKNDYIDFFKNKIEIQNLLIEIKIEFYKKMVELCNLKNSNNFIANKTIIKGSEYEYIKSQLLIIAQNLTNNTNNSIKKQNFNNNIITMNKSNNMNLSNNKQTISNIIFQLTDAINSKILNYSKTITMDNIYTQKINNIMGNLQQKNILYFTYITNYIDLYIYKILEIVENYEKTNFKSNSS